VGPRAVLDAVVKSVERLKDGWTNVDNGRSKRSLIITYVDVKGQTDLSIPNMWFVRPNSLRTERYVDK
jgi:hypothetical protein